MNYSDDSNTRMMNIIEECDQEINAHIRHERER